MHEFVETYKNQPLVTQTVITCMTTLKKSRDDATGISCLVVGTETGQIIILDPTANSVLKKVINSGSFFLSSSLHLRSRLICLLDVPQKSPSIYSFNWGI